MIEKLSGHVAYAIMSFGGFLGMGSEEHSIPWGKLTYDTSLGGYRTDIPARHRSMRQAVATGAAAPQPLGKGTVQIFLTIPPAPRPSLAVVDYLPINGHPSMRGITAKREPDFSSNDHKP
jgi:hypothetical protein